MHVPFQNPVYVFIKKHTQSCYLKKIIKKKDSKTAALAEQLRYHYLMICLLTGWVSVSSTAEQQQQVTVYQKCCPFMNEISNPSA